MVKIINLPRLIIQHGAIFREFQDTMITWSESKPHHLERTWSTLTFHLRVGYISISFIHLNLSSFGIWIITFILKKWPAPMGDAIPNLTTMFWGCIRTHSFLFAPLKHPEISRNQKKSELLSFWWILSHDLTDLSLSCIIITPPQPPPKKKVFVPPHR